MPNRKTSITDPQNNQKQQEPTLFKNKLKNILFKATSAHLQENQGNSPIVYYLFEIVETLSFLWFFIHPHLNIYQTDSFLLPQLLFGLKIINFHSLITRSSEAYPLMLGLVGLFLVITLVLSYISVKTSSDKHQQQSVDKYIRKIVNFLFIFEFKVLSGPGIALMVNILFCNPDSSYYQDQQCYFNEHLLLCFIAGLFFLIFSFSILFGSLFYYIKNPFSDSYLGYPNRHYMLSKSLFKLLFPIFFAVNYSLHLQLIFITMAPILWGLYMFYHRLFNLHSYKHQHFYVEFFCEGFLFWMGVSSFLTSCFNGQSSNENMSFLYALISSIFLGFALVNLQKHLQTNFMNKCLQGELKKQDIQRFILQLISSFFHEPFEKGNLNYLVFSKLLAQTQLFRHLNIPKNITNKKHQKKQQQLRQMYTFLLAIIYQIEEKYKKTFIITLSKCILLQSKGSQYHSLHLTLELQEQKLSLIEEFALEKLKKTFSHLTDKTEAYSNLFARMFHYQQESCKLDELMIECANSNYQYWEELLEENPSIPKLRSIATFYSTTSKEIVQTYKKIKVILPACKLPTIHYLQFLMEVGANLRESTKIKEQLRAMIDKKQYELGEIAGLSGDQITMVAVDTIGNNLGNVVNCNSQIKGLLGYDKQIVVGKSVGRLMPKVYSDMHNSLMLNYLKEFNHSQDHNNPFQKLTFMKDKALPQQKTVHALDSDCNLLSVSLRYQIITSVANSLTAACFLKKQQKTEEGMLLIDAESEVIMGIDKTFAALIKQRLTGRQVVQQQIKLSMIFPQIKLTALQDKGVQETLLSTQLLKDDKTTQIDFRVDLKVRDIKTYPNKKLMTLLVHRKQGSTKSKQLISFPSRNSSSLFLHIELASLICQQNASLPQKSDINSIETVSKEKEAQFFQQKITSKQKQQMALSKKLAQFIERHQSKTAQTLTFMCYLIMFLIATSYLTLSFLFTRQYFAKAQTMYQELNRISDIPYQEAQITFFTNKIWCPQEQKIRTERALQFSLIIKNAADILTDHLEKIMLATLNYQYPLQYNQQKYYNFTLSKMVNNNIFSQQIMMTGIQGIQNYISSAKTFSSLIQSSNFDPPINYFISEQSLYLNHNNDHLLPSITISAANAFQKYFSEMSLKSLLKILLIKIGGFVMLVIFLLGVLSLSGSLKDLQMEIYELYNKIRLWEISELKNKCQHFLSKRQKPTKMARNSSLLRVFPTKTIIDIIENQDQSTISNKIQNTKAIKDNFASPQQHKIQNNCQTIQRECQQTALLQNCCQNVKINYKKQLSKDTILKLLIGIGIIIGTAILTFSIYYQNMAVNQLQKEFALLKNLGMVRKSLSYINLYSQKIVDEDPDFSYAPIVASELRQFYSYSSLTYSQLGDRIFKYVYGHTANLELYFTKDPAIYNQTFLQSIYNRASQSFQEASKKILQIDRNIFLPTFKKNIQDHLLIEGLSILGQWILIVVLLLLIHILYFKPISMERSQSKNMLYILPTWAVCRSTEAYHFLDQ